MTALQNPSSRRLPAAKWLVLGLLGAAGVAVWALDGDVVLAAFSGSVGEFVVTPLMELLDHVIVTRQFPFFLLLTALLAIVLPASGTQPFFSRGFLHDLMWFLYKPVFVAVVAVTYAAWLHTTIDTHLHWLKVGSLESWPVWARFAVGLLVADFFFWLPHLLMHKVPLLWKFHKVHHSQRELNFFSNERVHFVEFPMQITFRQCP